MSASAKLLWGEGQFLRPQHFQRQDAYHESRLRDLAAALHPYAWGVRAARFDADALATGVLRAAELSVVFPDGESYAAPGGDELPEPVALENLPQGVQEFTFYAALPLVKPLGRNYAAPGAGSAAGGASARWVQADLPTPDLFTDSDEVAISYLKKSVRLMQESEPRDQYLSLPVARIRRTSIGSFEIDPAFVPPSLSIKSSGALLQQLRKLLDALQAKVNALYGHHREPSQNVIEFRSGDTATFWLLHTASTSFAALSHLFHHPQLHPERLFQGLLTLAGSLMTFSRQYTLAELPVYSHTEPGPAFARLDAILRELLETVISTRFFAIALREIKPSYFMGQLDSQKIDERTAFYLAVASSMPAVELVDVVPLRFKLGGPDDVEKLVLSAMPGVRLVYTPQAPAQLPVKAGQHYFAIEGRGPLYDRMLQSGSLSIYVPSGIPDLKLDLLALAG